MKTSIREAKLDLFVVAPGVWGMKDIFVNVFAISNPVDNNWFLVDTGVAWSAPKIRQMAALLFGADSKPAAIILTHGHFDHTGSLRKLIELWDVPVYAHHLEIPYLTGVSAYPPPDPTVGGGLMSDISFLYPRGPIDIGEKVISLPQGGRIPGLPEWTYIHTPGHAPGHISLFRESDKVLLAGDAFVTTRQESALAVLFQLKMLSGPPKYFTPDWLSAASSVSHLADLEPEVVAAGHGRPMRGAGMRKSLHTLANDFLRRAVPQQGRYVYSPALMDDSGVVHIPPAFKGAHAYKTLKVLGITAGVLITLLLFKSSKNKKRKRAKAELKRLHKASQRDLQEVKSQKKKSWEDVKIPLLKKGKASKELIRHEADDISTYLQDKKKQLADKVYDEASQLKSKTNKKVQRASSLVTERARNFGEWVAGELSDGKAFAKRQVNKGESFVDDTIKEVKSGVRRDARQIQKPVKHWLDTIKFKIPHRN